MGFENMSVPTPEGSACLCSVSNDKKVGRYLVSVRACLGYRLIEIKV